MSINLLNITSSLVALYSLIGIPIILCTQVALAQSDSGTWIDRAPMPTPRQEMPHVLLDGEIYVPGGIDAQQNSVQVLEVYNPIAGSWSTTAPIPMPMHHLGAAAAMGKLYVLGGYSDGFTPTDRVFEYDPAGNSWTEKTPMPAPRGAHVAVAIGDLIYAIGGERGGLALTTNQMYDPATDTWTERAPMPTGREHLAAAVLDGRIYVVGGRWWNNASLDNLPTVEVYDPVANAWDESPADLPIASGGLAAAALNGRLYAFGGEFFQNGSGVFSMAAEYDPASNTWRELDPMPAPRHGMGAVAAADTIFIIGGGLQVGFATSDINAGFIPPEPDVANSTDDPAIPAQIDLFPPYPDPFYTAATLRFSLNRTAEVRLTIHDVLGRTVETLLHRTLVPGLHEATWDATSQRSGVYLVRLQAGEFVVTRSLVKF